MEWVSLATGERTKHAGGFAEGRSVERVGEFSADGARYLTAEYGKYKVRDTATGKTVFTVALPNSGDTALARAVLALDGKGLAVIVPRRRTATIWHEGQDAPSAQFGVDGDNGEVTFAADGKTVATVESDGAGRVVRLRTVAGGDEVVTLPTKAASPRSPHFSPDGKTLAVFTEKTKAVSLHDPGTGKLLRTLTHPFQDYTLWHGFTPDGTGLVGFEPPATAVCLDVATGKARWKVPCPAAPQVLTFRGFTFTGPDRAVAWGYAGSAAFVWEVPSGRPITPAEGHTEQLLEANFTADGKQVVTTGQDRRLIRWDAASGKQLGIIKLTDAPAHAGTRALSRDGRRAVVGSAVYDLGTGKTVAKLPDLRGVDLESAGVLLSAKGERLVVAALPFGTPADDLKYVVCDGATGKVLREIPSPRGGSKSASLSADGSRLVVVLSPDAIRKKDTPVRVVGFDTATGKQVGDFTAPGLQRIPTIAPDNKTLVFAVAGGRATAYDLLSGTAGREYGGPAVVGSESVQLSPDGRLVSVVEAEPSSTGVSHTLRTYDRFTGDRRAEFSFSGRLLAVSPDGTRLVTTAWPAVGTGTSAVVWDIASEKK